MEPAGEHKKWALRRGGTGVAVALEIWHSPGKMVAPRGYHSTRMSSFENMEYQRMEYYEASLSQLVDAIGELRATIDESQPGLEAHLAAIRAGASLKDERARWPQGEERREV